MTDSNSQSEISANSQPLELKIEVKAYLDCPACLQHKHYVQHLIDKKHQGSFGPWYCDKCNYGIVGKFEGQEIKIAPVDDQRKHFNCVVVLECGDYYFILKGTATGTPDNFEHHEYLYNEHTCPTNITRDIIAVIDKRTCDTDPHGALRYVKSIQIQDEYFTHHGDLKDEILEPLARQLLNLDDDFQPIELNTD